MDKTLHAIVHGRVQGVSFRYHTMTQARRLELDGWVRNLADGSVELLASGPEPALRELAEWLERGPALARVDDLVLDWRDRVEPLEDFAIRH
jgi:acylphosphatase